MLSALFRNRLKIFFTAQGGNAVMFVGLAMMALSGAVGSAIDMGRAQLAQAKMSSALDSAGLAAGAVANSQDITSEMNQYFYANFTPANYSTTITSLTIVPNADSSVLTLNATGTVTTTFMRIFGTNTVTIAASSEITRAQKGMELVLVLDITGSMAGSKITSLRNAAADLINVLYGSNSTLQNFWVGMVPYVASVNIGPSRTSWLTTYDLTRYPSGYPASATKWKGCVEERASPYDTTDDPPSATNSALRWPMYFWADHNTDNDWIQGSTISLSQNYGYSDSGGKGPNIGCGQPIQPFTSSKSTILAAISGLQEWRRGGTASSAGLAWGWRMISPNWRGVWDHELVNGQASLPLAYNTPLMNKVVVLMTDGINQFFDQSSADPPYSDYTAYKRLDDLRPDINTTSQSAALTIINSKTTALCNAMKAQGIIIYTVTFQLGGSSSENTARSLFRSCATYPEYYFDAESQVSGAAQVNLRTAFKAIGDSLANLRVSH